MALIRGAATDGKDVSFKSEDVLYAVRLSDEIPADGEHTTRLFTCSGNSINPVRQIDLAHPFSFVRDTLAAAEPERMVTTTAKSPVAGRFPDKPVIFNKAHVTNTDVSATALGCLLVFNGTNRQNQFPPLDIKKDFFSPSLGLRFWVPLDQDRVSVVLNPLPPARAWMEREREPEYLLSSPPKPPAIPALGDLIHQHIPSLEGPRNGFNDGSFGRKNNWRKGRHAPFSQPKLTNLRYDCPEHHIRGPKGKRLTAATHTVPGLKR
jgi:hypothetical protein